MRRYYPHILLVVLALIAIVLWLRNWSEEAAVNQVGETIVATPAKEVRDVPKVAVTVNKPVQVYAGGRGLKEGIKLPTPVVENAHVEVISSSKIDGRDDHPKTVTTVLNVETGESETYVRTDPLPLFDWSSRGHLGIAAGLKNGEPAVRLSAEQELFTVMAMHFGAVATFDQPLNAGASGSDYFVGVMGKYQW
jgi:hypothetical protein